MSGAARPCEGHMRVRYRFLVADTDRHGNTRIYFRHSGVKIRVREEPGSAAFQSRYDELVAAAAAGTLERPAPPRSIAAEPGTLGWLWAHYSRSGAFRDLDPSTQATRIRVAETMFEEPVHPGAQETFRAFPVERIRLATLEVLRDRKRANPGAANHRVRVLRGIMKWAKAQRHLAADPSIGLTKVRSVSDGHHTWTLEEVAAFEARHGAGTKARLALHLMLYTGARRSDVVRLGRPHLRGGLLSWTAHKNRRRHPVAIDIPVLAPLAETLSISPLGEIVFLVTEHAKPFAVASFGNWFRARCDEAGLPQCSAHGLRKVAATLAAEAGATPHQLMSMFGWRSLAEAERYTRAAERRRLAASGMSLLQAGLAQRTQSVPLSATGASGETKRAK